MKAWQSPWMRFVVFLLIGAAGLAIGGLFTGPGVDSEWYKGLNKAPWTPPGWVFGAAWTLIVITFAWFMAQAVDEVENKSKLYVAYAVQWVLNMGWNPLFFYSHETGWGLVVISALTLLVAWFTFGLRRVVAPAHYAVYPYFLWLLIATSLNAYIWLQN